MSTIGILAGRDRTFTDALIARINRGGDAKAEYVRLGGVRMADHPGYRVILDRISHAVPFYQTFLLSAAAMGVQVVNDPVWQQAEDRFVDVCLARAAGLPVARSALLPNYQLRSDLGPADVRSLVQPPDWEAAMAWVGFPMILRPIHGAAARQATLIRSPEELRARWEGSGTEQLILQEWFPGAAKLHCLVIGGEALPLLRPPAPRPPGPGQDTASSLAARAASAAEAVSEVLGYEMNAVELAIRGDDLVLTDWLNYCPPIERDGLTAVEMDWAVSRTSEVLLHRAATPKGPLYRWDGLLGATG